jgi:hypothetical protein
MVDYLSGRIVSSLAFEGAIEADDKPAAIGRVTAAFTDDLMVEDRLNDEVREIMNKYSDEMMREGVQYHEMFKKIKRELIHQRKLIL